jgi:hypothetical protein
MNLRVVLLAIALTGCSSTSQIVGLQAAVGGRVDQPGVSFTPPLGKSWSVMVRSTYQVTLGARGPSKDETFITSVYVYQLPSGLSPEQFLEYVKKGRTAEPQTGRFEVVRNDEHFSDMRREVCVEHRTTSKDYGVTRGQSFATIDYVGMNCIHPADRGVGVLVELSRKAPPSLIDAALDAMGAELLRSVTFVTFK